MSQYAPYVLSSFTWFISVGIISVVGVVALVAMSPAFKK